MNYQFLLFFKVIIIILALVLSRIPPLSSFEDNFIDDEDKHPTRVEEGRLTQRAMIAALERAKTGPGMYRYASLGIRDLSNLWFNIIPAVLVFATVAMIFVEHTSLFEWLAQPFVPMTQLAQMGSPALTAKAIVAGDAQVKDIPGLKRVFRLHPPRGTKGWGGIKRSFVVGGALGARGDAIGELVERMI